MDESLQQIYDGFADIYEANRGLFDMHAVFDDFRARLAPEKGDALDPGCGAGEPFAKCFIELGWQVTGVDFSRRMLQLAERYVPKMRRVHGDMSEVDFPPASFDAVTAVYSLFHLPRSCHPVLFANIRRWLRPGGRLLFTYATRHYTGADSFDGHVEFMASGSFTATTRPSGCMKSWPRLASGSRTKPCAKSAGRLSYG